MAVESLSRDLYGDKLKNKKIDELNLEETNDALGALQKYCEDLGGVAREDREELDALQAHIQKLESGSSQSSTEKSEFKSMNVSDATAYLTGLKDKSWSDLRSTEGAKWIGAVQVVLNDTQKSNLVVDGNLGKKGSKTRAAVAEFQKKNGLTPDGLPGKNTIKALLGEKVSDAVKSGSSEKLTEGQEDKVTNWTRSGVDGSFTGTTKVKGGEQQPWNGEFTLKNGSKVEIKDGNMQS